MQTGAQLKVIHFSSLAVWIELFHSFYRNCEESFIGKDKQNFEIDTDEDGCLSYAMR